MIDFKDIAIRFRCKMKDGYYHLKCLFNPNHQELRQVIPKTWADLDWIMEEFLFQCVKSLVELEKGGLNELIKEIYWRKGELQKYKIKDEFGMAESELKWYKFHVWLFKTYLYVTVQRPRLQGLLDSSYPPLDSDFSFKDAKEYKKTYKYVIHYEELIKKLDDKYLKQIVEKRIFFWT